MKLVQFWKFHYVFTCGPPPPCFIIEQINSLLAWRAMEWTYGSYSQLKHKVLCFYSNSSQLRYRGKYNSHKKDKYVVNIHVSDKFDIYFCAGDRWISVSLTRWNQRALDNAQYFLFDVSEFACVLGGSKTVIDRSISIWFVCMLSRCCLLRGIGKLGI